MAHWPRTSALNFSSLAYFPRYFRLFILGVVAVERGWLRAFPAEAGKVGFGAALGATLVLFPLALSGDAGFLGGGNWHSAIYALWVSIFSVGMAVGLIVLFRRAFNQSGWLGRVLSRSAFAVYVIHAPIISFLAVGLRGLAWAHRLKFGLAALIGVPMFFALGVRRGQSRGGVDDAQLAVAHRFPIPSIGSPSLRLRREGDPRTRYSREGQTYLSSQASPR